MAYSRKDKKGRVLRKGETQRKCDGKYVYTYTDTLGRRRSIYSKDIKTLREREEQLIKDQLDGLDTYVAGSATVNFVFDRYISTKSELRATTRTNYKYITSMKEVSEQLRKLRRQYLRYQQAEIIYSISHKKLFELASDAGAIYRIDGTVLINRDIFDAYLE